MSRAEYISRLGNENNIFVTSGGNIGIGSTIPTSKLNVTGITSSTNFTGDLRSTGVSTVTTINATTATITNIVGVNTIGVTTAYVANINDGPISGMRNRIINGGMEVSQRGTTATGAYSSVYVYASVDRWAVYSANSSTTQAQSTDVPSGFRNSFKLQRPSGNTGTNSLLLIQGIESVNCYDLSGKTVTLSFWAKCGGNYSGGTLGFAFITGTTADQGVSAVDIWAGRATPISSSAAITTTWSRYTITGTVGSGVLEAAVQFSWTPSGTAGADDSVYITGVQLEAGTVATPFERRSYGLELALCQRYFEKSYNQSLVPGTNVGVNTGEWTNVAINVTDYYNLGKVEFRVTKRTSPSANIWSTDGTPSTARQQDAANVGVAIQMLSENGIRISSSGTTFTANNYHRVHWAASAEL